MKPTHIILTDQGIGCIEAPTINPPAIKTFYNADLRERYEAALKQAIDNMVMFNHEDEIKLLNLHENGMYHYTKKGKLYPVPDGYEVKIRKEDAFGNECFYQSEIPCNCTPYAVLVPKQEPNSYQIKEANELIMYIMKNTTGDHNCWLSPRIRKQFEKYAKQFEIFKQDKK